MYDYLIVGAGLYGSTFACLATRAGKKCLVIDKRPQVGGNLYCENLGGIAIHKYGPHIFHTSDREVWDFVNSFVPFNHFKYSPLASHKGKLYNLPFNMNTFYALWGVQRPEDAQRIIQAQRAVFESGKCTAPQNLEEQALWMVGRDIYDAFIKEYSQKQWGRPCTEMPADFIKRIPVRFTFDNNYFQDPFQGIPQGGYNLLIERMLSGIECRVNTDYFKDRPFFSSLADKIVFTGCIDEFFDFRFGHLDYRSLRFEQEILEVPNFQGNVVVNYSDLDVPYTRITEHKHFEMYGQSVYDIPFTVITREYPSNCTEGREPYYPIPDQRNTEIFNQYKRLAEREEKVVFGGRLAEYKYLDMAPIIREVLSIKVF